MPFFHLYDPVLLHLHYNQSNYICHLKYLYSTIVIFLAVPVSLLARLPFKKKCSTSMRLFNWINKGDVKLTFKKKTDYNFFLVTGMLFGAPDDLTS